MVHGVVRTQERWGDTAQPDVDQHKHGMNYLEFDRKDKLDVELERMTDSDVGQLLMGSKPAQEG